MLRFCLLSFCLFGLVACSGTPQTANTRPIPPACVERHPSAFKPEQKPSTGGVETITNQTNARVLQQSASVIGRYEGRLEDSEALERRRVQEGCLQAR